MKMIITIDSPVLTPELIIKVGSMLANYIEAQANIRADEVKMEIN